MNKIRLMVYSHDAFGLGNLSRMLAICDYLLSCWPQLSILLVSGSPMVQGFRLPKGLDYIKLPCLNRGVSGQLSAKYLGTTTAETVALRSQLILSAAAHFKPDLLLVDKKPTGLQGEITPTLNYLRQHHPNAQRVLLLRDILDTPKKTIAEWQKWQYGPTIQTHYDQILVVGMQSVFDVVQAYQLPLPIARKVRYCGYIRKQPPPRASPPLKHQLGITAAERLVLVTPGGGEDGYSLIKTYLAGLQQRSTEAPTETSTEPPTEPPTKPTTTTIAASTTQPPTGISQPIHSLVLCGPEMPAVQQATLQRMAATLPNVTLRSFSGNLLSDLADADGVVSMGGYNTLTEILTLGKCPVVVPRIKPSQEQYIRATRFAQRGLVRLLHPEQVTPRSLIQAALAQLTTAPAPSAKPADKLDFNGLPRLAHHLEQLVRSNQPGIAARCLLA